MSILDPHRPAIYAGITRIVVLPVAVLSNLVAAAIIARASGDYAQLALGASALVFVVPVMDLGLGSAVMNAMSRPGFAVTPFYALRMAVRMLALVGGVLATASISWLWTLSGASPVTIPGGALWPLTFVFAIVGAVFPMAITSKYLVSVGRNYAVAIFSGVSAACSAAYAAVCAHCGLGGQWLILATPVGILLGMTLQTAFALRVMKNRTDLGEPEGSPSMVLHQAAPSIVVAVCALLVVVGLRSFGSVGLSGVGVASFLLAFQIFTAGWSILAVAAASYWPVFASMREGSAEQRQLLTRAALIAVSFSLAGGAIIILLLPRIVRGIGGPGYGIDIYTSVAFAVLLAAQASALIPSVVFTTTAGLRFQAICAISTVSGGLLACWTLSGIRPGAAPIAGFALCTVLFQTVPSIFRLRAKFQKTAATLDEPRVS